MERDLPSIIPGRPARAVRPGATTAVPPGAIAPPAAAIAPASRLAVATAGLRITFGVIWAADAALKWLPAFAAGFVGMLGDVAHGQPTFLKPWFDFVTAIASDGRGAFLATGAAVIETYLAVALLTGFARKVTYTIGAGYALMIWAAAEGFGGPYVAGVSTDVGAGIVYALLFAVLLVHDAGAGSSRLSLDSVLGRRLPGWRRFAELDRATDPRAAA